MCLCAVRDDGRGEKERENGVVKVKQMPSLETAFKSKDCWSHNGDRLNLSTHTQIHTASVPSLVLCKGLYEV